MKQIFVMKHIPYYPCKNVLAAKPKNLGYDIESARFLGFRIWYAFPSSIKELRTLNNYKETIKNYDFGSNCRLCKLYLENFGFL